MADERDVRPSAGDFVRAWVGLESGIPATTKGEALAAKRIAERRLKRWWRYRIGRVARSVVVVVMAVRLLQGWLPVGLVIIGLVGMLIAQDIGLRRRHVDATQGTVSPYVPLAVRAVFGIAGRHESKPLSAWLLVPIGSVVMGALFWAFADEHVGGFVIGALGATIFAVTGAVCEAYVVRAAVGRKRHERGLRAAKAADEHPPTAMIPVWPSRGRLRSCPAPGGRVRMDRDTAFEVAEIRAPERALEAALESADPTAWVFEYTEDAVSGSRRRGSVGHHPPL